MRRHDSGAIQTARIKLGLSQEQFARALGIKLSRLQSWEHGRATLNMTHAELHRFQRLNAEVFDAWVRGEIAGVRSGPKPPHREPGRRSGIDLPPQDQDLLALRLCA